MLQFKVESLYGTPSIDQWKVYSSARKFARFVRWSNQNFNIEHRALINLGEYAVAYHAYDNNTHLFSHPGYYEYAFTITRTDLNLSVTKHILSPFLNKGARAQMLASLRNKIITRRSIRRDKRIDRIERDIFGSWIEIEYVGGVHTKPGVIMGLITMAKKRAVVASKEPKSAVNHIGVEIEFLSGHDRDELGDKFIEAGLEQYVQLKEDGSVHSEPSEDAECDCGLDCCCGGCSHSESCATVEGEDGLQGHEICVLATQREFAGILRRVCAVLNDTDAQVNKTCGLHVHLDMRTRERERGFNNLVRALPVLTNTVPSQRRDNQYCRRNSTPVLKEQLQRIGGRYWAINPAALDDHDTIEIRLHSGTTNADKIINWIRLLVRIVEARELNTEVTTLTELNRRLRLPSRLRGYFQKRIEKFKQYRSELDERAA